MAVNQIKKTKIKVNRVEPYKNNKKVIKFLKQLVPFLVK